MKYLVLLLLPLSAYATESSDIFRCEVSAKNFKASIAMTATGQGRLNIVAGASKFVCPLALEEYLDNREAHVQGFGMLFNRQEACEPELTEPFLSQLRVTIDVSIETREKDAIAHVFLMERKEAYPCKIKKMSAFDFDLFSKRVKAKGVPYFAKQPVEPKTKRKPTSK